MTGQVPRLALRTRVSSGCQGPRPEAAVVPVILRPCDWQTTPLGALQALPAKARPIVLWEDRDEAWLEVVTGLRRLIAAP